MITKPIQKPTPKRKRHKISRQRVQTHLVLALGACVGCLVARANTHSGGMAVPLSLGLGYVSLVYLVACLLIGPLYLTRQKRNPVNLSLRRDIGIWTGITAVVHVAFSRQIFEGGQSLLYYFYRVQDQYLPRLDLFGISNYLGLLAILLTYVLLFSSNDAALKWLKGKRWKRLQRLTYPLIALASLHTLGYQLFNARGSLYIWALGGLLLVVLFVQGAGFLTYRKREMAKVQTRRAPVAAAGGAASVQPCEAVPAGLSRRRFVVLTGSSALAAMAAAVSLRGTEQPVVPGRTVAKADAAGVSTDLSSHAAVSDTAKSEAQSGAYPGERKGERRQPAYVLSAVQAQAVIGNAGVLSTLAACSMSSAITFTNPDTGETGTLKRKPDSTLLGFGDMYTGRF